jgi:ribose/xylose/arabinose/galactoside ABC-type transport system permease subunit
MAGVAMGAINAFFIVVLRVIPFIVTLATLFLFRGFGTWLTSSTQFDFPEAMRTFGLSTLLGVPMPIIVFAIVALAAHLVLAHTTFGRQIYALGNDAEAARKSGVNTRWVQARVYVISSACAAVAGFVLIAQIGRLDVAFGEGREFDVIAAAVLGGASLFGGTGTAFGAVVGATLIQTVKLGLVFTGVNLYLQPILLGLIIFLAVLADGFRGQRLRARLRRTIRPVGGTA